MTIPTVPHPADPERAIYAHLAPVALKIDRLGNLLVWRDRETRDQNEAAYVQNSQNIDATLEDTDLTVEERADLDAGYTINCGMIDELAFCLFGIEY